MSVFFVDCPKIPFRSVLSLSCCCLSKIYTSYIISKCKSVKIINIPWFLAPHFYLLSAQNQWKPNSCRQTQYFRERPYVHVSWKIYLFTSKKIAFMSSTEMIIPFRIIFSRLWHEKNIFYGINFCDVGILWKKCGIYFCDPNVLANFVLPSLKKKIQYIWE